MQNGLESMPWGKKVTEEKGALELEELKQTA